MWYLAKNFLSEKFLSLKSLFPLSAETLSVVHYLQSTALSTLPFLFSPLWWKEIDSFCWMLHILAFYSGQNVLPLLANWMTQCGWHHFLFLLHCHALGVLADNVNRADRKCSAPKLAILSSPMVMPKAHKSLRWGNEGIPVQWCAKGILLGSDCPYEFPQWPFQWNNYPGWDLPNPDLSTLRILLL